MCTHMQKHDIHVHHVHVSKQFIYCFANRMPGINANNLVLLQVQNSHENTILIVVPHAGFLSTSKHFSCVALDDKPLRQNIFLQNFALVSFTSVNRIAAPY